MKAVNFGYPMAGDNKRDTLGFRFQCLRNAKYRG